MDPLLAYFGGKTYLAPWISSYMPPGPWDCYVEPFCGSAAVFFAAPGRWANSEVLNDINGNLINLFRVLQDDVWRQDLIDLLDVTPFGREQWQEARNALRERESRWALGQPVQRAWAFFVAHTQSFNGARRSFRVPARTKDLPGEWRRRIERMPFYPLIERLKQAALENCSFEKIIPALDSKTTLFYIDPPYIGAIDQASMKEAYSGFSLSKEQDELLIKLVKSVHGAVVMSGYARDDLPEDWQRVELDVPVHSRPAHSRHRPGKSSRARATEVLYINPRAQIKGLF